MLFRSYALSFFVDYFLCQKGVPGLEDSGAQQELGEEMKLKPIVYILFPDSFPGYKPAIRRLPTSSDSVQFL